MRRFFRKWRLIYLEARYQESIKTHAFLQQELDALKTRMAVSQHLLAEYRTAFEQDLEQTVGILQVLNQIKTL